jgi:hypothetical protein
MIAEIIKFSSFISVFRKLTNTLIHKLINISIIYLLELLNKNINIMNLLYPKHISI